MAALLKCGNATPPAWSEDGVNVSRCASVLEAGVAKCGKAKAIFGFESFCHRIRWIWASYQRCRGNGSTGLVGPYAPEMHVEVDEFGICRAKCWVSGFRLLSWLPLVVCRAVFFCHLYHPV